MHIDHIAIRVVNVEASQAFYQQVLGSLSASLLTEGSPSGRVDLVRVGDSGSIELYEESRGFASNDAPPIGFIHFAVSVSDVDAAYERAIALGAAGLRPPADNELPARPGRKVRVAFVQGPSGEVVEFINTSLINELS